ncbi:hypothetical protein ACRRTK_015062 [Alexandromys fortis]
MRMGYMPPRVSAGWCIEKPFPSWPEVKHKAKGQLIILDSVVVVGGDFSIGVWTLPSWLLVVM